MLFAKGCYPSTHFFVLKAFLQQEKKINKKGNCSVPKSFIHVPDDELEQFIRHLQKVPCKCMSYRSFTDSVPGTIYPFVLEQSFPTIVWASLLISNQYHYIGVIASRDEYLLVGITCSGNIPLIASNHI